MFDLRLAFDDLLDRQFKIEKNVAPILLVSLRIDAARMPAGPDPRSPDAEVLTEQLDSVKGAGWDRKHRDEESRKMFAQT